MLATLTLSGLPGTDTRVELRPLVDGKRHAGAVTVYGRSASGKTMLLVAYAALLTGDTLPAPRRGCDAVEVVGVTGLGVTLTATRGPRGSRWAIAGKGEEPVRYSSATDYRAALVQRFPFLADAELVRLLLRTEGIGDLARQTGRPLRDLIARLQVPALVERMRAAAKAAGADFTDTDLVASGPRGKRIDMTDPEWHPRLVANLEERQRELNRAVKETAAAAQTAAGALAAVESRQVQAPADEAALTAARTVVSTAKAWAAYRTEQALRDAEAARIAEQRTARDAWRTRKAEIGAAPVLDTVALTAAEKSVTEAAALVRRLEREEQDAAMLAARQSAPVKAPAPGVAPEPAAEFTPEGFTLHPWSYNKGIDDAFEVVAEARESGETDHRSMLRRIERLHKPIAATGAA